MFRLGRHSQRSFVYQFTNFPQKSELIKISTLKFQFSLFGLYLSFKMDKPNRIIIFFCLNFPELIQEISFLSHFQNVCYRYLVSLNRCQLCIMHFITPFLFIGISIFSLQKQYYLYTHEKVTAEDKKTQCYVKVIHVFSILGWIERMKCH